MKNLFTRSLTGIFLIVIVLGGTILHPASFFLVQLLIMTGSLYEYYRLVENETIRPNKWAGIIGAIVMYGVSVSVASGVISPKGYLVLLPLVVGIMVAELYRNKEKPFDSIAQTITGLIYIAVPWSMIPFSAFDNYSFGTILHHNTEGFSPAPILVLFILLWVNDTGAYLVGITVGKHKLFKRISPKKSWEGFIGGVLVTAAAAWALSGLIELSGLYEWLIVALLVSVGGTFGDLVESMLKRGAGVKDSGSILPGHGGMLDRFDSVLFAWPLMYLFLTIFG